MSNAKLQSVEGLGTYKNAFICQYIINHNLQITIPCNVTVRFPYQSTNPRK